MAESNGVAPDLSGIGSAVPEWVHWIAQDEDGGWWGYEHSPNQADHGWYENEVGRVIRLTQGAPPADWQSTLRQVRA